MREKTLLSFKGITVAMQRNTVSEFLVKIYQYLVSIFKFNNQEAAKPW